MHEDIVEALSTAHQMMAHIITLIRVQIDMLYPDTDSLQFEFLSKAIGYMNNFPGIVHHPAEDLIFERLVLHAPQIEPLCAHLIEQHNTFKSMEAAILGHIPRAQSGDGEACRRIKALGLAYCTDHVGHIDDEEGEALPQAVNWLSADDWREIGNKLNFAADPLSDPKILTRYDSLYDFIMEMGTTLTRH